MEQQVHSLPCFFGFIIHRKSYYSERSSLRSTRANSAAELNLTITLFASSGRKLNNRKKAEATRWRKRLNRPYQNRYQGGAIDSELTSIASSCAGTAHATVAIAHFVMSSAAETSLIPRRRRC